MNIENTYTEKLFSYGTLQREIIQHSVFGRKLNGAPDKLMGYYLESIEIKDPDIIALCGGNFYFILRYSSNKTDEVNGTVFDITPEELVNVDEYELDIYQRIKVQLVSGIFSWVYIGR